MSEQPATKQCSKCGEVKALTEFYQTMYKGRLHVNSFCKKPCFYDRQELWRKANRDRINRVRKTFVYNRRELCMWRSTKCRAKQRGIEFTISVKDIVIPDLCPVLGIELIFKAGRHDGTPSLDRINPKLGYIPGNVRVISWLANRLKSNGSARQLHLVAQDVICLETNATLYAILDATVIDDDNTADAASAPLPAHAGARDGQGSGATDHPASGRPAEGDAAACVESGSAGEAAPDTARQNG